MRGKVEMSSCLFHTFKIFLKTKKENKYELRLQEKAVTYGVRSSERFKLCFRAKFLQNFGRKHFFKLLPLT